MGQRTYDYYTLLPHFSESRVFLLPTENDWTLPHFRLTGQHNSQEVGEVNRTMLELLGIRVTTLRCLSFNYDPQVEQVQAVFALDNRDSNWIPTIQGRWVGCEDLDDLRFLMPEHRAVLGGWFAELNGGRIPAQRVPWAQAGWFGVASEWIRTQLEEVGYRLTAPVEQLRAWCRSTVLQAHTASGDMYFKAVPAMFSQEPSLTLDLAERCPSNSPKVLAIDRKRHWLLMEDFSARTLNQLKEIAFWEEAMRVYSQIQLDYVARIDDLIALGCPDWRLEKLGEQIEVLLADTLMLRTGREWARLSEMEIEQLRGLSLKLQEICAELANSAVPPSLDHGDFADTNIAVAESGPVYFDWSDACVTHPFFSLSTFFRYQEEENFLPDIPDVRTRLRNAYLEPWTVYSPMDRLIQIYELTQILATIHQALKYSRIILPNLEPSARWETDNMLPFWLKTFLHHKDGLLG